MKKIISFLLLFSIFSLTLFSCKNENNSKETFSIIPFTHYSSGGVAEKYEAVILFEQSNSTFTSYQVAFSSCNCRDASVSYLSVMYIELLNEKESADNSAIRTISFNDNKGLWGDSNPNYYVPEYTEEYYNEHFVQQLVKVTKSDIDAWEGYGKGIEMANVDSISGATVSCSNITSMIKSIFDYHEKHYY